MLVLETILKNIMNEKAPKHKTEDDMTFEEFVRLNEEHEKKMKTDKQYRLDFLCQKKEKSGTREFDLDIYQLEKDIAGDEKKSK